MPTLGTVDWLDLLLRAPPIEYSCSQSADIHSPGFNRYVSVKVVSLVIAALVAAFTGLGQFSSTDKLAQDIKDLKFLNTAQGADPQCTAKVSEASAMIISALPIDKTWALCEAAKAAAARAGLKSSAAPTRLQSPAVKR